MIKSLSAGTYYYKYFVDDKWCYDVCEEIISDGFGSNNNVIEVLPISFNSTEITDESEIERQNSN